MEFGSSDRDCIRDARRADLSVLTTIAHQSKQHWGYPSAWMSAWEDQLTILPMDLTTQRIFVAESDGQAVGFCSVSHEDTTWSLEHLWVRPDRLGRKIGQALMNRAADYIAQQGGTTLSIESDPNALGFYLRLGARQIGKVPAHVGENRRFLPLLELAIR